MKTTNRQATTLKITSSSIIEDHVYDKNVDIQRLSWFDALFSTIKTDLASGNKLKAERLADLGQYLAKEFQHDSEDELTDLLAGKECSL